MTERIEIHTVEYPEQTPQEKIKVEIASLFENSPIEKGLQAQISKDLTQLASSTLSTDIRSRLLELETRFDDSENQTELLGNINQAKRSLISTQEKQIDTTKEISASFLNSLGFIVKHAGVATARKVLEFANTHRSAEEQKTEIKERYLDARLELMLAKYAEKINEGKTGVIFKLDTNILPEMLKKKLQDSELASVNEQGKPALKLLKVFDPRSAAHEYQMQTTAWTMLNKSTDKNELAQIPQPWFSKTITVRNEKTLVKLEQAGVIAKSANQKNNRSRLEQDPIQICLIVMDYLPGEDLATHLYKWVLLRRGYEEATIENMQFQELQDQVGNQLGFEEDVTGSGQEFMVSIKNAKRLINFLQSQNFKFNPELIKKLRKSLQTLHQNKIFHNDLHWRNIMASGEIEGSRVNSKKVECNIIDFEHSDSTQHEGEDDFAILKTLDQLS